MMMTSLTFACRRCGAAVDAGAKAALVSGATRNVLLDCACAACGHRALYGLPIAPAPGR